MTNLRQFLNTFANDVMTITLDSKNSEEAQEKIDDVVNFAYSVFKTRLETMFTHFLGTVENEK